jgi:hypothetical protein
VTIGKKENILIRTGHIELWVVTENTEVQGDKKISTAKRSAGVTRLAGMDHTNYVAPNLRSRLL